MKQINFENVRFKKEQGMLSRAVYRYLIEKVFGSANHYYELKDNGELPKEFTNIIWFVRNNNLCDTLSDDEMIDFINTYVTFRCLPPEENSVKEETQKEPKAQFDKIVYVGGFIVPIDDQTFVDTFAVKPNKPRNSKGGRKKKSSVTTAEDIQRCLYRVIYNERCKYRKALSENYDATKALLEPITKELYDHWIAEFLRLNAENGIKIPDAIIKGIHYPKMNRRWAN